MTCEPSRWVIFWWVVSLWKYWVSSVCEVVDLGEEL